MYQFYVLLKFSEPHGISFNNVFKWEKIVLGRIEILQIKLYVCERTSTTLPFTANKENWFWEVAKVDLIVKQLKTYIS